jgi:hypothetical protein
MPLKLKVRSGDKVFVGSACVLEFEVVDFPRVTLVVREEKRENRLWSQFGGWLLVGGMAVLIGRRGWQAVELVFVGPETIPVHREESRVSGVQS